MAGHEEVLVCETSAETKVTTAHPQSSQLGLYRQTFK